MSEARHTPGPWDNTSHKTVVRQTETAEWIAEVGGCSTVEAIANAALIAAAPDLLRAAIKAVDWLESIPTDYRVDTEIMLPLVMAIMAARGES